MSALTRATHIPLLEADWQPDVLQLLDEHHLVAWSDAPDRRTQFAAGLSRFLGAQRDAEVCVFYGRHITDLDSFCSQLERAIPGPGLERRLDGPRGVVPLLRSRTSNRGRPETKYRFYVWHDADVLLRADHRLFGRLVDAFAGVAAEAEYVSDDLLLIHRSVYVGSSLLDVYAEDPKGQFRAWYVEPEPAAASSGGGVEPFWQVVTGILAPPFLRFRIDRLDQQLHATRAPRARVRARAPDRSR